jgi:chromosome segregation ATPase
MEQYKNSMTPSAQPVRVDALKGNDTLERKLHSLEQRLVEQAEQIQALTKELKRCKLKIDEHSNHINKIKLNG